MSVNISIVFLLKYIYVFTSGTMASFASSPSWAWLATGAPPLPSTTPWAVSGGAWKKTTKHKSNFLRYDVILKVENDQVISSVFIALYFASARLLPIQRYDELIEQGMIWPGITYNANSELIT